MQGHGEKVLQSGLYNKDEENTQQRDVDMEFIRDLVSADNTDSGDDSQINFKKNNTDCGSNSDTNILENDIYISSSDNDGSSKNKVDTDANC